MIAAGLSLLAGVVFGVGLAISGMVNPQKVLGFLDFAGNWDPTLAFVMGGALLVKGPAWLIARRMESPVVEAEFSLPANNEVDARLVGGAALFGAGWGLVGFCPGPAIAALPIGGWPVASFALAMMAGMLIYRYTLGASTAGQAAAVNA